MQKLANKERHRCCCQELDHRQLLLRIAQHRLPGPQSTRPPDRASQINKTIEREIRPAHRSGLGAPQLIQELRKNKEKVTREIQMVHIGFGFDTISSTEYQES